MKTLKTLSTADLHFHKDYLPAFRKSAKTFIAAAEEEKPDLIIIAGDLADRTISNSGSSEFNEITSFIQELIWIAPVACVEGTKSHDIPGSLNIFEQLTGKYQFTILQPGMFYHLENGTLMPGSFVNLNQELEMTEAIIVGIPEPNKSWLLANSELTGEEARQAAEQALNALLTLISAQLHDVKIPKIGVFHGTIKGASISETQTMPEGGIALTPAGLAGLGFDYISCGHIHMRQEIAKNIWYEGSFFPKTWGEKDRKEFSVVTYDEHAITHITRQFPHPPMEKITIDYGENIYSKLKQKALLIDGYKLWLEIRLPAHKRAEVDTSSIKTQLIKEYGVTDDSRVSVKLITPETARAPEIAQQRDIAEKFKIWHESSIGTEALTPGDIEKLNEVREEIKLKGYEHKEKRLRLDTFYAKGSKGIVKGQHKQELSINFLDYDPGLIALLGDNGAGKTTMIDLCAPYSTPVATDQYGNPKYRKMTDLFYLQESECTKEFTDLVSGVRYKTKWIIKPKLASPKTEFYFYIQHPGQDWEPYNDSITGLKDPYDQAVLQVFGSPEMYRRSAYIAQGNNDLPATTKGRKELFNELVGLEYLEVAHEFAKQKADAIKNEIESQAGTLSTLREMIEVRTPAIPFAEQVNEMQKDADEKQILAEGYEKAAAEVEEQIREEEKKLSDNRVIQSEINSLSQEINQIRYDIVNKDDLIKQNNRILEGLENAEKTTAEHDTKVLEMQQLRNEKQRIQDKNNEKRNEYEQNFSEYSKKVREIENGILIAERGKDSNINKMSILKDRIKRCEELLLQLNDPCPQCGYLSEDVHNQMNEQVILKEQYSESVKALQQKDAEYLIALSELNEERIEVNDEKPTPPELDILVGTDTALRETERYLQESRAIVENAKQIIIKAKSAAESLKNLNIEQDQLVKRYEEKTEEYTKKKTELLIINHDTLPQLQKDKKYNDRMAKDFYNEKQDCLSQIKLIQSDERNLQDLQQKVADIESKISGKQTDLSSWKLIQKGLSRDGIQALELDALSPSIAAETNELLEKAYGPKFSIRFQTTKEVGKGSDKRQAEDYEIFVTNNEVDDEDMSNEQEIATLSGGERVWILKALYDAFGIIRERNTGLAFATTFQDEADGALSPEKKHLYLTMVERAHHQSDRYHTIYITHDQAIMQSIEQQIVLKKEV